MIQWDINEIWLDLNGLWQFPNIGFSKSIVVSVETSMKTWFPNIGFLT